MERIKKIKQIIDSGDFDDFTPEDIKYLENQIENNDSYCESLLDEIYRRTNILEEDINIQRLYLHNLGAMYYEGIIVEKDIEKALEYLKKSLEQKESFSACIMAVIYYLKTDDNNNSKIGYEYFKKAIDLGNDYISVYIEKLLEVPRIKGLFLEDFIKLINYSIEKGNLDDYFYLGKIYDIEKGDYKKAYEYYTYILNNKDNISDEVYESAAYYLGLFYLNGKYVNVDLDKAKECFKLANDEQMLNQLAYYLGEKDKLDFKQALDEESYLYDEENDLYFKIIKNKINNNTNIVTIKSIKELTKEKLQTIPKESLIFLDNQSIESTITTSLYTYEQIIEIIASIDEIINKIDLSQNEEDIFMQIYIIVLESISPAINFESEDLSTNLSDHNLYSLITKKGVCQGYSQVLQTLLEFAGIKCNIINSTRHQYNQVRLNDKWYYCDLLWDKLLGALDYCLKSSEEMAEDNVHIPYPTNEIHEATYSYPNIEELYKKNLKKLYGKDYLEQDTLNLLGKIKIKDNN